MLPEGLTFSGNVKMNGSTTNYTYDADSWIIVLTAPTKTRPIGGAEENLYST